MGIEISLHSFVLGFLFGCGVFFAVWRVTYLGPSSGTENYATDSQLERIRPSLASYRVNNTRGSTGETREESHCSIRRLRLLVLILSAPKGTIRRNAIRGTWLHDYSEGSLTVTSRFLVGTLGISGEELAGGLEKENANFKDLLLLPSLLDSYSNLTAKVLLGMQWAAENVQFDYVLKTDDDSYVRLERLMRVLEAMRCPENLFWGYFMGYGFPVSTGKWKEKEWFLCPHYLPYAMGGGYVLSQSTVSLLLRFSHRLKMYSNEDVSMATWLAPYRLLRKHDLRFDVESVPRGCNNNHLISHKCRVRMFYDKYTSLTKNHTYCPLEKEVHPGYIYNWTANPLHCCSRIRGLPVTNEIDLSYL